MQPTVKIRLARPADMFPISRMARELIETGLGWSWTPSRVGREILSPETVVLAACHGEQVIAFAIMHFGDDTAHLNLLAVELDFQRAGIGRRLVVWLEESALTAGIASIGLELRASNQTARRFYCDLGYHETGVVPGYYRGLEAAIRMARALRPEIAHDAG
ncbi:MAG: GNAT family N-acetyltransferase [Burkholderiales bacterium]|nr:GNAT family N-acetyltransferase [Burkholderiales bacterium]